MKKHLITGLSLLLVLGASVGLSSCGNQSNNSSNEQISQSEQYSVRKLKIKSLPNKLEYAVGEAFSSEGLKVSLAFYQDSQLIKEEETSDFTLSIKEGTILQEGELEVMVKSTIEGVRSTNFKITTLQKNQLEPLIDVVNRLVSLNNYTVDNVLGGETTIKGLMNKDALIWTSNDESYFPENGLGYGTYENKTYRFKLADNQIKEAVFISDLGSKAVDDGLFSPDTLDDMAERRISNYNIQGITKEELDYLKNECHPVSDNPNRYEISTSHCKWLFNAIGHTQLSINPTYHLTRGKEPSKIFIEVKEYGLDIDLITPNVFDGILGCVAKITNIGTTVIPGLKEFKENPVFEKKKTNLDLLQDNLNGLNYSLISATESKSATFTKDYVYSDDLASKGLSSIELKANNKLNKDAGTYGLLLDKDGNVIVGEKQDKAMYLTSFDIFKDLNKYFKQDESMNNKFTYNVTDELEKTSQLTQFLKTFAEYEDGMKISQVNIDLIVAGTMIFQANIEFVEANGGINPISLINFNTSSIIPVDEYIANNLY